MVESLEPYTSGVRDRCQKAQVWKFVEFSKTIEMECRDKVRVSHTFTWKEGSRDDAAYMQLKKDLDELRLICGEQSTEKLFESQMSRMLIEIFVDDFLWHSNFGEPFKLQYDDNIVVLEPLFPANYNGSFDKLEHMIDVLFCFAFCFHSSLFGLEEAKKHHLELFCHDIRRWPQKLVGIYLEIASHSDYIRLLHHILNCPGIGKWGANFVRFPTQWDYTQASHFIDMLSVFLSPSPLAPSVLLDDEVDDFVVMSFDVNGSAENVAAKKEKRKKSMVIPRRDLTLPILRTSVEVQSWQNIC